MNDELTPENTEETGQEQTPQIDVEESNAYEVKIIMMGQAPQYVTLEGEKTIQDALQMLHITATPEQLMHNGSPVTDMTTPVNNDDTIVVAPKVKGGK